MADSVELRGAELEISTRDTAGGAVALAFVGGVQVQAVSGLAANLAVELDDFAVELAQVASGTTITPGTGHLVDAGYAPTVTRTEHQTITPGKGALILVGYAPSVSQTSTLTITPGKGSISVTGFAPSISQGANQSLSPGTGHLTLGGYTPVLSQTAHRLIGPAEGHIVLAGHVPTITQSDHHTIAPGTGHTNLRGYAPTISNGGAVWPDPSKVLNGIQYGPTGLDYTGTASSGGSYLRRR
jgi:hypothetical protein